MGPDWYLESLLNNHINEMIDRYFCLRAIRVDLFYQYHTAKYHRQNHRQPEMDLRLLMAGMMQSEVVVDFFWSIKRQIENRAPGKEMTSVVEMAC